jgi:hypothetical protein
MRSVGISEEKDSGLKGKDFKLDRIYRINKI